MSVTITEFKAITDDYLKKVKELEKELGNLDDAEKKAAKTGDKAFDSTTKSVDNTTKATKQLSTSMDGLGKQVTQIGVRLLGAFAIQQVIGGAIRTIKEFDESIANLRKTTGLSANAARDLADQIRVIDTKTSVTALLELGTAAGRLGLKGKDVLGFTVAADKAFVALGDSLEGSAEDIALTLGKLASSFNLDKEFGVGDSIERIGSALNVLGANSKATEGPIVNFTKRLAGVASQANISLTDIAALGALFDSTGQSIEVAATTLNVLLPAIGKDVQKFAQVAGVNIEEFTKLVETDAVEALKLVALGAKSNQEGLAGLSETLESFGVDSARAASIVGILSSNVDELTRLQDLAAKGLKENTSLTDEFNIKNNTLSASTAKLGKAYDNFIISLDNGDGVLSTALIGVVDLFAAILEGKETLEQSTDELIKSNSAFASQESRVNSLLEEYDSLTAKTELNKNEQERLLKVIQDLGKEMPTAIAAFNDLGEAIEINTDKVRENLTIQKQALGIRNKSQIVDLREEIDKLNASTERNTASLRSGTKEDVTFTKTGRALITTLKLTSDEILNLQEQNVLNKDSIIETTKSIQELGGVLTETESDLIGVSKATKDLADEQEDGDGATKRQIISIASLEKALAKLQTKLKLTEIGTAEFRRLEAQVLKSKKQLEEITGQSEKTQTAAEKLKDRLIELRKELQSQALAGNINNETLKEFQSLSDKAETAQKLLKEAIDGTNSGFEKANKEVSELKKQLEEQAFAGDVNNATLERFNELTKEIAESQQELKAAIEGPIDNELERAILQEEIALLKVKGTDDEVTKERIAIRQRLLDLRISIIDKEIAKEKEGSLAALELEKERASLIADSEEEQREEDDKTSENAKQRQKETLQASIQTVQALADFVGRLNAIRTEKEIAELEKRREAAFDNDNLSKEDKIALEEKFQEERKAILTKQAQQDKALNIFNATIGGAAAVIAQLSVPAAGPALAIAAAITAALNLALIIATPIPTFHTGQVDIGNKNDEFGAKLQRGETVTTRIRTRQYKQELQAIHEGKLEDYINQNYVNPEIRRIVLEIEDKKSKDFSDNIMDSLRLNAVLKESPAMKEYMKRSLQVMKKISNQEVTPKFNHRHV